LATSTPFQFDAPFHTPFFYFTRTRTARRTYLHAARGAAFTGWFRGQHSWIGGSSRLFMDHIGAAAISWDQVCRQRSVR